MQLKLLSVAALIGAAAAQSTMDFNATIANNSMLTNLTSILGQFIDLLKTIDGLSNITVLAPSDQAIGAMLNGSIGSALTHGDSEMAKSLLRYHVLNGTYPSSALINKTEFIPTLLSNSSYANVTGGQRLEAATVGGNVTFYSGLLMNSSIIQADLNFTGGIIHIINSVLTEPLNVSTTALDANLTSVVGALTALNLTEVVDTTKDVTIFAPSNKAFQSVGSALENLSASDLTSILEYHVVKGTVGYSSILANNTMLQTLGGQNITITVDNGTIFVDSARVIIPDVLVANGVVHVIDNVLNPNNTSAAPPSQSAASGTPAFPSASSVSGIPFVSGVSTPTMTIATNAGPGATSTTKTGAAPMKTAAAGQAVLFGGAAAIFMNF